MSNNNVHLLNTVEKAALNVELLDELIDRLLVDELSSEEKNLVSTFLLPSGILQRRIEEIEQESDEFFDDEEFATGFEKLIDETLEAIPSTATKDKDTTFLRLAINLVFEMKQMLVDSLDFALTENRQPVMATAFRSDSEVYELTLPAKNERLPFAFLKILCSKKENKIYSELAFLDKEKIEIAFQDIQFFRRNGNEEGNLFLENANLNGAYAIQLQPNDQLSVIIHESKNQYQLDIDLVNRLND